MTKPAAITEIPLSPEQDRRARMARYSIAMGIRVVCIFLCLFVQGWWLLLPAAGAILLPYFAVVIANNVHRTTRRVERPGTIVRVGDDESAS
jgi:predicted tellurium resistance membrane protein TerC